jgi:hypothetical protein
MDCQSKNDIIEAALFWKQNYMEECYERLYRVEFRQRKKEAKKKLIALFGDVTSVIGNNYLTTRAGINDLLGNLPWKGLYLCNPEQVAYRSHLIYYITEILNGQQKIDYCQVMYNKVKYSLKLELTHMELCPFTIYVIQIKKTEQKQVGYHKYKTFEKYSFMSCR